MGLRLAELDPVAPPATLGERGGGDVGKSRYLEGPA
jgi:hypothetical protein